MQEMVSSRPVNEANPCGLRFLSATDVYYGATLHNILIMIWKKPPTVEALIDAEPLLTGMVKQFPDGFAVLAIAQSILAPEISLEINKKSAEQLKACGKALVALANVVTCRGLTSKFIALSMKVAVSLSGSTDTRQKVFDQVSPAATWLTAMLNDAKVAKNSEADLLQAVSYALSLPEAALSNDEAVASFG